MRDVFQIPALPPAFDPRIYRKLYQELSRLSDDELCAHYDTLGKAEGRVANELSDRRAFAHLISSDSDALEIGPFASPLLQGPSICYCDVLDENELRIRAKTIGVDPGFVPKIHYKLDQAGLDGISRQFSAILSSHSIEHQPDLVGHLKQVERRLERDGRYFLLIPDRRYCFDRQIASSTIADVIQAHEEKRKVHTLKSVIEHYALTVHNDSVQHWSDRDFLYNPVSAARVCAAIDASRQANGAYIDVHAWYFTPDSFNELIATLNELGLTSLRIERLYRTRNGANEFWAILKLGEIEHHPDDARTTSRERDRLLIERDSLRRIVGEKTGSIPPITVPVRRFEGIWRND